MEVALVIASTAACGPRVYGLCQQRRSYSVEDASYDQFVAHDSSTSCTLCGTANCTDAVSPFYACYPYNKTCSVCGSSSAPIGPDYTVTIQKSCSTARPCNSNSPVVMRTGYTFAHSNGLTIEGQTDAEEVKAACPVFVFVHAVRFAVRNLVIDCESSSGNPAAAIVIQKSSGLVMTLSSLTFMGSVEVGVFATGTDRSVEPPQTAMSLDGSVLSAVSIQNSTFRIPYAVSLASFYGAIDVTGMAAYSPIFVEPVYRIPTARFVNTSGPLTLVVRNITEYVSLGSDTDYILDPTLIPGFTVDTTKTETGLLFVIALVQVALLFLLHPDFLYYIQMKRKQV